MHAYVHESLYTYICMCFLKLRMHMYAHQYIHIYVHIDVYIDVCLRIPLFLCFLGIVLNKPSEKEKF